MYVDALVFNMNVGIVKSMAILGIGGVGLRAQYIFSKSSKSQPSGCDQYDRDVTTYSQFRSDAAHQACAAALSTTWSGLGYSAVSVRHLSVVDQVIVTTQFVRVTLSSPTAEKTKGARVSRCGPNFAGAVLAMTPIAAIKCRRCTMEMLEDNVFVRLDTNPLS